MSSTPTYATPGLIGAAAAPATTNFFVAAVILGLFVLSAVLSAARKAYVAHIQHSGDAWPDLNAMRLLDPHSFQFTGAANYLNHPPIFYDLLAALGPTLEGRRAALLAFLIAGPAIFRVFGAPLGRSIAF